MVRSVSFASKKQKGRKSYKIVAAREGEDQLNQQPIESVCLAR